MFLHKVINLEIFKFCLISFFLIFLLLTTGVLLQTGYKKVGVIAIFWCFLGFMFVNIYSSTLTSFMSITYQRPDVNSFKDLANNPNYQAIIQKGSIGEIDILVGWIFIWVVLITFNCINWCCSCFYCLMFIESGIWWFETCWRQAASMQYLQSNRCWRHGSQSPGGETLC